MIPWDRSEPVITDNFSKLGVAFHQAIARKEIIGVVSPNGIGFKYVLKRFVQKHYLKVVYCNVRQGESVREVLLSLYRHLCNVNFSNIDYRKTTLFDLVRVINYRLEIGDNCLLCIDKCSNLKPAQLEYFVQFLQDFNKPIGLVFRMSESYANKLATKERFSDSYSKLEKVVDNWRVLNACTVDEIRDIVSSQVKCDRTLINDIVKASNRNLTTMRIHMERILRKTNGH